MRFDPTLDGRSSLCRIFERQLFHIPIVTSDLVSLSKLSNHGRGRDGRVSPCRRDSKSFV
jgi:hypothetical protein